jgi:hypothetical protein
MATPDGIIYAFGGDTFDGGSLIAQTIAEKMDPTIGTWDDASVADLPTAGDEGRAFGFNSDSVYGIANQIVIATLAQWSGASAEVILYDVATNMYDITFEDLINARRNHAGVFIPTNSDDPNDGLPGMWVFGGYLTGDNPPYAPAEFYPLAAPTTCNVLLVDDDWDFDAVVPNDGGRPYYTSTLDVLGTLMLYGIPSARESRPLQIWQPMMRSSGLQVMIGKLLFHLQPKLNLAPIWILAVIYSYRHRSTITPLG